MPRQKSSMTISDLKHVIISYNGHEKHYCMIDVPREGELVAIYTEDNTVIRTRVKSVLWTASPEINEYGYPEVEIIVTKA